MSNFNHNQYQERIGHTSRTRRPILGRNLFRSPMFRFGSNATTANAVDANANANTTIQLQEQLQSLHIQLNAANAQAQSTQTQHTTNLQTLQLQLEQQSSRANSLHSELITTHQQLTAVTKSKEEQGGEILRLLNTIEAQEESIKENEEFTKTNFIPRKAYDSLHGIVAKHITNVLGKDADEDNIVSEFDSIEAKLLSLHEKNEKLINELMLYREDDEDELEYDDEEDQEEDVSFIGGGSDLDNVLKIGDEEEELAPSGDGGGDEENEEDVQAPPMEEGLAEERRTRSTAMIQGRGGEEDDNVSMGGTGLSSGNGAHLEVGDEGDHGAAAEDAIQQHMMYGEQMVVGEATTTGGATTKKKKKKGTASPIEPYEGKTFEGPIVLGSGISDENLLTHYKRWLGSDEERKERMNSLSQEKQVICEAITTLVGEKFDSLIKYADERKTKHSRKRPKRLPLSLDTVLQQVNMLCLLLMINLNGDTMNIEMVKDSLTCVISSAEVTSTPRVARYCLHRLMNELGDVSYEDLNIEVLPTVAIFGGLKMRDLVSGEEVDFGELTSTIGAPNLSSQFRYFNIATGMIKEFDPDIKVGDDVVAILILEKAAHLARLSECMNQEGMPKFIAVTGGGYTAPEAQLVVRAILKQRPDLPVFSACDMNGGGFAIESQYEKFEEIECVPLITPEVVEKCRVQFVGATHKKTAKQYQTALAAVQKKFKARTEKDYGDPKEPVNIEECLSLTGGSHVGRFILNLVKEAVHPTPPVENNADADNETAQLAPPAENRGVENESATNNAGGNDDSSNSRPRRGASKPNYAEDDAAESESSESDDDDDEEDADPESSESDGDE